MQPPVLFNHAGKIAGHWRQSRAACVSPRLESQVLPGERFVAFIVLIVAAAGCHLLARPAAPVVEFVNVPPAAPGNPHKLTVVTGRAIGAQPHQVIVLYAKDKASWYVQPYGNQPFTKIQPDSTWRSLTHPGTDYAALRVEPEFHPPPTTDVLPTQGVIASAVTKGTPPFWQTWWFLSVCLILCLYSVFALYRFRLHQMADGLRVRYEERLAERMRVAQVLHDTLLQGVISASMQLNVAMDRLPEDSPALGQLRHVLETIGQVVEEGRYTLRGLRSNESVHDLERALAQIPSELGLEEDIDFAVIVKGKPLPLQPAVRVNLYSICREILINALRQSGAKEVRVELRYTPSQFRLVSRHDGHRSGFDKLHPISAGSSQSSGFRQQAEKIGAHLKIRNRLTGGAVIDLQVPAKVAFGVHTSHSWFSWLDRMYTRRAKPAEPDHQVGTS